jgi:predicted small secreted protein
MSIYHHDFYTKLRRIALWFVLTISVPSFCACNTVAGFGKDMEKLGDKIEKKAEQKNATDQSA